MPNITVTSLPDDYVHFSQPRSLTVREWARLQIFSDWYQFSEKELPEEFEEKEIL